MQFQGAFAGTMSGTVPTNSSGGSSSSQESLSKLQISKLIDSRIAGLVISTDTQAFNQRLMNVETSVSGLLPSQITASLNAGKAYTDTKVATQAIQNNQFQNAITSLSNTLNNIDLSIFYTKPQIDLLISTIQVGGGDVDLTAYYTKPQVDGLIAGVTINNNNFYTKAQTDSLIFSNSLLLNNYYLKTQIDSMFYLKTQLYTKAEVDSAINNAHIDLSDYYTHEQVDDIISLNLENYNPWANTQTYIAQQIQNAQFSTVDLSQYYNKTEVDGLIVPFITQQYFDSQIQTLQINGGVDLSQYWKKSDYTEFFDPLLALTSTQMNAAFITYQNNVLTPFVDARVDFAVENAIIGLHLPTTYALITQIPDISNLASQAYVANYINTNVVPFDPALYYKKSDYTEFFDPLLALTSTQMNAAFITYQNNVLTPFVDARVDFVVENTVLGLHLPDTYALKTEIPSIVGLASEDYVANYVTTNVVPFDPALYYKKTDFNELFDPLLIVTTTQLNAALITYQNSVITPFVDARVDFIVENTMIGLDLPGTYALKTEIPSIAGLATTAYVDSKVADYVTTNVNPFDPALYWKKSDYSELFNPFYAVTTTQMSAAFLTYSTTTLPGLIDSTVEERVDHWLQVNTVFSSSNYWPKSDYPNGYNPAQAIMSGQVTVAINDAITALNLAQYAKIVNLPNFATFATLTDISILATVNDMNVNIATAITNYNTTHDLNNYYTKAQVDSLVVDASGLSLDNYYTKAEVDALVTPLQTTITTLQGQVTTLQGQMTTAMNNITTLQNLLVDYVANMTALTDTINQVQSNTTNINNNAAASAAARDGLQTQINTLTNTVNNMGVGGWNEPRVAQIEGKAAQTRTVLHQMLTLATQSILVTDFGVGTNRQIGSNPWYYIDAGVRFIHLLDSIQFSQLSTVTTGIGTNNAYFISSNDIVKTAYRWDLSVDTRINGHPQIQYNFTNLKNKILNAGESLQDFLYAVNTGATNLQFFDVKVKIFFHLLFIPDSTHHCAFFPVIKTSAINEAINVGYAIQDQGNTEQARIWFNQSDANTLKWIAGGNWNDVEFEYEEQFPLETTTDLYIGIIASTSVPLNVQFLPSRCRIEFKLVPKGTVSDLAQFFPELA